MLLWNTPPTKENLCQRMLIQDSCCALCKHEIESPIHLFIECPIAKVLWQSCYWGLKPEEHSIQSPKFLIKLILDPPNAPCPKEDQWLIPLNMASILDEIWFLRNQSASQGIPDWYPSCNHQHPWRVCWILNIVSSKETTTVPHLAQVASQLSRTPPPPPPKEWIKVNKYIAILDKAAAVAVIPCNYKGEVLKV